jgi:predicted  nucleic acid-binding Zn-ribbon protein
MDKQCPKCGGEMWDNRAKKASGQFSSKSPDFSCKDKVCRGAIWPEKAPNKDYPVSEAEAPDSPWSPLEAKARADARSSRIERQHSQDMAIQMAGLIGLGEGDALVAIKELTDWFQADLENS